MDIQEYKYKFGERVKELREDKKRGHLTQQYLAEKLGVSIPTLSRIENGSCALKLETVISIAEFFDVSVDYLLGRTERKKVSKIRSTSTETKDVVRGEFTTKNKLFDWNELGKPFNNNS